MRILLLNSEYPPIGGGAGNASANIASRLESIGHELIVVTSYFHSQPKMEIRDNVKIYRIPAFRKKQDRSRALEQLAFIISASFWTLKSIRQLKPEVTLAFFGVPSGAVAWILKKVFNIPYIVSLRGGDVPGFRPYDFQLVHKLLSPFIHIIWKDASAVIANSQGLCNLALIFDDQIKIPIIPNGVDNELYQVDSRQWSPPALFSVGRVVYQKGLDLGLRALAELKDLNWQWYIAGDGPQIDSLKFLASQLGIQDRVIFLGWQSREDLLKWYHQSNLFLFPSRHEGMPNAVLEAMASGLPVIATKIAGNEELVIDDVTGILVNAEDVESLRDGLHRLLVDEKKREEMGRASRKRVEEEYSWENVAHQYSEILERVKNK